MGNNYADILKENERRLKAINTPFNPITGAGSIGQRFAFSLSDVDLGTWHLPIHMRKIPLVVRLVKAGTITAFLDTIDGENTQANRDKVLEQLVRLRIRYDFPFWAALLVWIKNKEAGEDVRFKLTRPQRKLVNVLEEMRLAGEPIRVILLKARQWGGSTTIQMYTAWMQMTQRVGLNSLIIAHQGSASDEILDMFKRMIARYPLKYLYKINEDYNEKVSMWQGVGHSGLIHSVPQRNCKVKIGTAERPDSCRGGSYSLVHLSEVGIWKTTDGKRPEDIVQSACSGILLKPYTMIVMESTAKGTGTFFHSEWQDAVEGKSLYKPLFIAWFDIDQYSLPFEKKQMENGEVVFVEDKEAKQRFAQWLWDCREKDYTDSNRAEPGRYYWRLWEMGATLEALHWYVKERSGRSSHSDMASEYPSDHIEAFTHAGERVFDQYLVDKLAKACRDPRYCGEVYADDISGKAALSNVRFAEDTQGALKVWQLPEHDTEVRVLRRYLVVVDIGGRSKSADWSVIVVFDRVNMADLGPPSVVAQWRGHLDHDLLAWKAAQIAAFYDNAFLVIESNTLETKDNNHDVDGDMSDFILNQIVGVYPNLYARKQSEDAVREGAPLHYGFHTNVSTKPKIIANLQAAVRDRLYIEREKACCDEMLTYEKHDGYKFDAIAGKHDDILMTRAIGLWVCFREMEPPAIIDIQEEQQRKEAYQRKRKTVSAATI